MTAIDDTDGYISIRFIEVNSSNGGYQYYRQVLDLCGGSSSFLIHASCLSRGPLESQRTTSHQMLDTCSTGFATSKRWRDGRKV